MVGAKMCGVKYSIQDETPYLFPPEMGTSQFMQVQVKSQVIQSAATQVKSQVN